MIRLSVTLVGSFALETFDFISPARVMKAFSTFWEFLAEVSSINKWTTYKFDIQRISQLLAFLESDFPFTFQINFVSHEDSNHIFVGISFHL